jgi:poly(3-hydroxybutyrate) depolymerase
MKLVCLAFFSAFVLAGCAATAPPASTSRASAPAAPVAPAITAAAPLQLPVGKSQFEFVDKKGDSTRPVKVWMFVPESCDTKCPLQFVMHGVKRNGEEYLDNWVAFAKERKFIVITPEFSSQYFPDGDDYILGRSTTEKDPNKWAFAVPEHLFDELKSRYGFTADTYRMFGHSAGGQFVHRMHLFSPQHRASPIIAANPGWYTEFEWGMLFAAKFKYPYNTSGSQIDEARTKAVLSRPFVLMLGDQDTDPNDPNLNKTAGANLTGLNRYARGQNFFENARRASQRLNVNFPWQLQVVRGVAHDNAAMAAAAIKLMYPESK